MRSQDAHDAALRAAVQILEERGYAAVTVEGVAAQSGVAKSTIYRWWSNKAHLVMEAYGHLVAERMPAPDTGDLTRDLTAFVTALYGVAEYPTRMRALRGLMAEAQLDPVFAEAFQAWVQTRRDILATVFTRAIDHGELAPDVDVTHAIDLIFGPFWYRLLVRHAPIDPVDAVGHVHQLLHGLHRQSPS
ncbi:TetR/AcrR family transcriptional regulator [Dactylosporangium sp. McL0621]|uniref:TetR/AcrR family transcriptional regulator n=1 Tax=Dactylosporangium sp. McL0621 TaxID=3415678 RepID=UPI003CF0B22B